MKPFASRLLFAAATAALLSACGARVEVPPAHVGKIMTKDGYQDTLIPTSKFRLSPCWAYCDRLVLLHSGVIQAQITMASASAEELREQLSLLYGPVEVLSYGGRFFMVEKADL